MNHKTERAWQERAVKGVGVNIWAPEWYPQSIRNFDAETLAELVADTGAEIAFTFQGFTQDHFGCSCFPTKLGHIHANLSEGRDHIGEYVGALHARGIKVFAYYSFPDGYLWERNPDWRQKDSQGNDILHGAWGGALCVNSPYRDYFIQRLREIAENYEADGFLADTAEFNANPLGCYCSYCKRKFRERYGCDLPTGSPCYNDAWKTFVHWRYDCLDELLSDARATLLNARPGIVFTHNAFGLNRESGWSAGEHREKILRHDDIVTSIAACREWSEKTNGRHVEQIWKAGYQTRCLRGLGGKPVWMQTGRFPYDRDYQAAPVHELSLTIASIVSNGGCPIFIDNCYPDGTPDRIAYERMKEAYALHGALEPNLNCTGELDFAALLYSVDSEDFHDLAFPNERRYSSSFHGAFKALQEGHIPFQVIGERGLTAQNISRFRILVLPEAAVLSDAQAQAIREYARDGGAVIATGRTSLADGKSGVRGNFALSDLFGADYVNPLNYIVSYIKPELNGIFARIDQREHIPMRGCQLKVAANGSAEAAALVELPATEVAPGTRVFTYALDVPPERVVDAPAALLSDFGRGRCAYFSGDIAGVYGVYGYPSLRKMLLNAVEWACRGDVPLRVQAPMSVQVSCFRDGDKYLIHLVNYTVSQLGVFADRGGTLAEEGIPCRDIRIMLKPEGRTPKRVWSCASGEELQFTHGNGIIIVLVPVLDLYDIIAVE